MKTLARKSGGLRPFVILTTSMTITRTFIPVIMAAFLFGALPANASAASLEVSGWIPYWRTDAGSKDAKKHLSQMAEINPFAYSVKTDGTLADTLKIDGKNWQSLIRSAERKDVRVIPTVMWSDTQTIHAVLSDPARRAAHIKAIVDEVEDRDFDGIDIDYEGKLAETRPYFSAFLKELSEELDGKHLSCTIEARMPLSARFSGTPPANIEYANDLPEINKYCDRVKIMTYDQQTADVELNAAARKTNEVYGPVADVAWVKKVVDYMGEDIDTRKIMIGVATYGYIYQVIPNTSGVGYSYIKTEAFNPKYATDLAKKLKITPERNAAGELSFSYVPKEQTKALPTQAELVKLAPRGTSSANAAAAGALELMKKEGRQAPVQYLTWSDAGAIKQKVDLAKKLGVAGIAIFKIDGGSDPKLWSSLK